ncbi:MAG: FxsA family protein [Proteobacteria bacterium]|nr:FxsA family protein [Pseudomonadota bacterium]
MGFILLLFILTPIVEIAVFIQVGGLIGLWPTLGLVVATAVAGTALLRRQGLATMRSARESLARGEFPVNEIFDGACLLASGLLLLTPGFITDFLGALFLAPMFRAAIRGPLLRWLMSRTTLRTSGAGPGRGSTPGPGSTIDAEFHEIRPADQPDDARNKDRNGRAGSLDPPDERG